MTRVENFCGLALTAGSFWLWERERGKPGWTVCVCACVCVCALACVCVPRCNKGTHRSHTPGVQGAPWEQPN